MAKVVISWVLKLVVKTDSNPDDLPKDVFDGLQVQMATNRAQLYRDLPGDPFYGFNRPGAMISEAIVQNCRRQGMMGAPRRTMAA